MPARREKLLTCPDCGNVKHNPRTGFCWKTGAKGYHCKFCCLGVNTQIKAVTK